MVEEGGEGAGEEGVGILQVGHLQAPLKELYCSSVRRLQQALWTHFRQEVHLKDITSRETLQPQTPHGQRGGPGFGHCPERSSRRVMSGEVWVLPGRRRSCGSRMLRLLEKTLSGGERGLGKYFSFGPQRRQCLLSSPSVLGLTRCRPKRMTRSRPHCFCSSTRRPAPTRGWCHRAEVKRNST